MNFPSLSDLLRRERKRKGLTHQKLRESIASHLIPESTPIAQSTLSTWENAAVLPDLNDPQLRAIAYVLDINDEELQAAHAVSLSSTIVDLEERSDEELAHRMHDFTASIGNLDRLTITLVGPKELPMAESPQLQKLWVSTLAAGANYRLLLLLDELQENELRLLFRAVESLTELLAPNAEQPSSRTAGHVEFVPVFLYERCANADAMYSLYERMAKRLSEPAQQLAQIRKPPLQLNDRLRREINQHWFQYGVVALYDPGTSMQPLANFCGRMRLLRSPEGDPLHSFFWIGRDDTRKLQALVDSVIEEFEDYAIHMESPPTETTRSPLPADTRADGGWQEARGDHSGTVSRRTSE